MTCTREWRAHRISTLRNFLSGNGSAKTAGCFDFASRILVLSSYHEKSYRAGDWRVVSRGMSWLDLVGGGGRTLCISQAM